MIGFPLVFGDVVPRGTTMGKLAKRRLARQIGIMKMLSPFAVLVLFGCIGLLTGKFGLWFPFGFVAAVIVAIMQKKRTG
ncbi:hypothetical protein ACWGNZ_18120 [Sphingomonas zeae]